MPFSASAEARSTWRQDFLASIVVFLVAVPLCMGIALASGAPVAAGLVTGIVGGLLVGTLAGAPLQVSGPAAGLTVICGEVIRQQGLAAFGIVVMIAGAVQLAAGLARMGKWFRAVSPAVVHGMLSGIGLLILSGQVHVLVDERPRETGLKNLLAVPQSAWLAMGLPTWEEGDVRRARSQLLREWNAVHDAQRNHARLVSRTMGTARSPSTSVGGAARVDDIAWATLDHDLDSLQERTRRFAAAAHESPLDVANGPAPGSMPTPTRLHQLVAMVGDHQTAGKEAIQERSADALVQTSLEGEKATAEVLAELKQPAWAGKLGLLAVVIIVIWPKLAKGRLRLVPAALIAVLVTTLIAWAGDLPVQYVNVPANLFEGLRLPNAGAIAEISWRDALTSGAMIAVIASAETLLCAAAVDQLHHGPRTRYDRELAAQGIGNLVCGMLGALPMTGVIVRSAANVQAGARSRMSAILHGLWLLVFAVLLTPVLNRVPVAALAGVLVVTGYRLIDLHGLVAMWRTRRAEALIFLTTMIVIIVEDLLLGVVTGIVLSALHLLLTFSNLEVEMDSESIKDEGTRVSLRLSGAATFLKLPLLAEALDRVPPSAELHADLDRLDFVDHACLELLANWAKRHESTGGRLVLDWGQLHARLDPGRARGDTAILRDSAGEAPSESPTKEPPASS